LPVIAWIGLAVLVLFGGCVGMCVVGAKGVADKEKKEKEAFDKQDAVKVTAAEIVSVYKANEVAGDEKFKGKKIEITGKIESIDSSIGDAPVVRLASDVFMGVMLYDIPKGEAAKLEKGKDATFVCKGDGELAGAPILRECKIK
jgi:hypothetical protein